MTARGVGAAAKRVKFKSLPSAGGRADRESEAPRLPPPFHLNVDKALLELWHGALHVAKVYVQDLGSFSKETDRIEHARSHL